jgi:hypothetical protein
MSSHRRHPSLAREAIAVLSDQGYSADIDLHGKHLKVTWTQDGRPRFLVIPRTPSNRYAASMTRAVLKRMLRKEPSA